MDDENLKVIDSDEKKNSIWEELANTKGEIICKGKDDNVCYLEFRHFDFREQIIEYEFKDSNKLESFEEFLGSFVVAGEKYYFYGNALLERDRIILHIPDNIYHLQRRQNYRVRIPSMMKGYFNIISNNEKSLFTIGSLVDLSGQGCRISTDTRFVTLQQDDKVIGLLIIDKKSPIELTGIVRHTHVKDEKVRQQITGIEFVEVPALIESKLFAILMEIHKQFYKKVL